MSIIDLIAGSRTDIVKLASIMDALNVAQERGGGLGYRLIHTGPRFDRPKTGDFFQQLGIPRPTIDLEVSGGTQAEQMANIMIRYEQGFSRQPSALCLVVSDEISAMACAIVAKKMGVPVAHVEGGSRSNNWTMPEEINRVVTDSITNWYFTTSESAKKNLRRAGVEEDRIYFWATLWLTCCSSNCPISVRRRSGRSTI